ELNHNYIRSGRDADVSWFDQNLAEDFVNSSPDCSLVEHAGFLTQSVRRSSVNNIQCEDLRIQRLCQRAIVRGRPTYITPDGQPGAGRYTDVWGRPTGRWVCVAANVSRG